MYGLNILRIDGKNVKNNLYKYDQICTLIKKIESVVHSVLGKDDRMDYACYM